MTSEQEIDRTDQALRFARVVKMFPVAFVALSVLQYLVIAASSFWPIVGSLESIIWIAWFVSFLSILPVALIWLGIFGRLASSEKRLRNTKVFLIFTIILWLLLVVGSLVLLAVIARGLLNFI